MATIHVDEAALNELKNALLTAGQEYKENLAKLTSFINEITNGDIEGDPAIELLNKFNDKQMIFEKITQTIEEAEDYMGLQANKFNNMLDDLKSGMK